jgi:hypothetical protein
LDRSHVRGVLNLPSQVPGRAAGYRNKEFSKEFRMGINLGVTSKLVELKLWNA